MIDVFLTVDVEIWCDGWDGLDEKFPDAFRKCILGPTPQGDFGLPYQVKVLQDHCLKGVFFVEPLFSTRFGAPFLEEVVGIVQGSDQEVQLHLHTEWVDESRTSLLDGAQTKRQHLRYFSLAEQTALIRQGADLLRQAGARHLNAFRAGSFAFNRDTLRAIAANGIGFDSSYNASQFGLDSGVMQGVTVVEPLSCEGVHEYPMTVFDGGTGRLRHAQLTACTYRELEGLLWQALEQERKSFVILSHGFELLNRSKDRPDKVVVERFLRLCAFLDRNRDSFRVRGFQGLSPDFIGTQPEPLISPLWRTVERMFEQAYRLRYG